MKSFRFHVEGMHCKSCKILIEEELKDLPEVKSAVVDLKARTLNVEGNWKEEDKEVLSTLNAVLAPRKYRLSDEAPASKVAWGDFVLALPIAGFFIAAFLILQKLGIVNWVSSSEMNLGTAFVIGIVASLSTCMAVVGGLVLSVSANFAKEGQKIRPQLYFHAGRLVSFFLLGGLIGMLGGFIQFGATSTFVLGLIVGVVMLILGLNLLDIFPALKRFQPTLPAVFSKPILALKNFNHTFTPVLLGIVTFFLPCGFTQSMQLYALSSGGFWTGALTLLVFALGTLPVLGLLSFSSLGIQKRGQSGVFFKAAGLVVLFFAVFNILNSFVAAGIISPFFQL